MNLTELYLSVDILDNHFYQSSTDRIEVPENFTSICDILMSLFINILSLLFIFVTGCVCFGYE